MTPARALRAALVAEGMPGFLRWDRSGRALLVSDAPRRGLAAAAEGAAARAGAGAWHEGNLLLLDLPDKAYEDMLLLDTKPPAVIEDGWFSLRALCYVILGRETTGKGSGTVDKPLLRAAMVAEAQGEAAVKGFVDVLRTADAEALRRGDALSCRACAGIFARWVEEKGGHSKLVF